ncbi:uncharacterized protein LOC128662256 isoform X2 [Bombina bombina]|uniref:uncharacterized protein LOC128662256 isoform X2 n=1 Tax=Bombina bombina TaxID=8345 RepID=UPI00235A4D41|nr:uncharacterized protein LOC128662256 isoform X2 [Bombina bombina]
MSYTNIYRNVDFLSSQESPKHLKKPKSLSVQSGIYVQEDSIHERMTGSKKTKAGKHWWRRQPIGGKYRRRQKLLLAGLVFSLILILYLILLCYGLIKYSALVSVIQNLKNEQTKAETLGSFHIYNEAQNKCAEVLHLDSSPSALELTANPCLSTALSQFFRWLPGGRLLSVEIGLCLGARVKPKSRHAVILQPCESNRALRWVCTNETLLGPHNEKVYFNYGNNPHGLVMFYAGNGVWSRWKARDLEGGLMEGGVCGQICEYH